MVGVNQSVGKRPRPFGQGEYRLELIRPTFTETDYQVTLLLPTSERFVGEGVTRPVFTREDKKNIKILFREDFGGATYHQGKGPPSIQGDFVMDGRVVVDWHWVVDVFARRHEATLIYFGELKARLMEHARDARHAEQRDIVLKIQDVNYILSKGTVEEITKDENRLKYLRR
jgi:hypothetical protein